MEVLASFLVFVLGLCCGSFVNMLVFRTAKRYKIQIPNSKKQITNKSQVPSSKFQTRSRCDYCGKQLSWYENIPVFSWVVQGGKSRCCGKKLPLLYPIVELAVGLLFVFNFYFFNFQSLFLLGIESLVVTMLVFAAVFDLKYMILPDFSTAILVGVAGLRLVLGDHPGSGGAGIGPPVQSLFAAAGGAGFLLILYWLTKGKGMGMGDVKLAVFMGLWLGWPKIVVAFYVAFVIGAVVGGTLMLVRKLKRKSLIAFGPFLILGTLVAWWWGEKIIELLK